MTGVVRARKGVVHHFCGKTPSYPQSVPDVDSCQPMRARGSAGASGALADEGADPLSAVA